MRGMNARCLICVHGRCAWGVNRFGVPTARGGTLLTMRIHTEGVVKYQGGYLVHGSNIEL